MRFLKPVAALVLAISVVSPPALAQGAAPAEHGKFITPYAGPGPSGVNVGAVGRF